MKKIEWVCLTCGLEKGTKNADRGATWHAGVCDMCGEKSYVTQPRDFGISQEDDTVNKLKNMLGFND